MEGCNKDRYVLTTIRTTKVPINIFVYFTIFVILIFLKYICIFVFY